MSFVHAADSPPWKGGAGGGSAAGGRNSDSEESLATLAYPPLAPPFQGGEK
jgi:uroporphyrin-III C-methyltransferase / precorrin-2 dehydrogenase / sirohydrochlorin ferrochelatase